MRVLHGFFAVAAGAFLFATEASASSVVRTNRVDPVREVLMDASRHSSPIEMRRRGIEGRYLVTVRRLGRAHVPHAHRRHAAYGYPRYGYSRHQVAPRHRHAVRPTYYAPRYSGSRYVLPYFAQPGYVRAQPVRPAYYSAPYRAAPRYQTYSYPSQPVYRAAPVQRSYYYGEGSVRGTYVAPQPRVIYGTPGWGGVERGHSWGQHHHHQGGGYRLQSPGYSRAYQTWQ